MKMASIPSVYVVCSEVGTMQGLSHRAGRSVRAHRAGRVVTGAFCLALAVTLAQTLSVSPTVAQNGPSRDASDTVLAWGDNKDGELGDGTTTDSSTPIAVDLPAGTTITAIAAGHDHSLAVTSAGTALAWGNNLFGQLGDGSTTDSSTPIAVDLPAGTTVTAIAAGSLHSLAVTTAGTILAWGNNSDGQLGDGTTTNSSTPIAVNLPADTTVTATTAGSAHSMALVAPPPDLPTTGPSLPTTLTIAALLLLTGAALIHLAHRYRPARRPR